MAKVQIILALIFVVCGRSGAQNGSKIGSGGTELRARIVLYNWIDHEKTMYDDFVVKTSDAKMPFARIIYRPAWGFDAPTPTVQDRLDRSAFVAHGSLWSFSFHAANSIPEKAACARSVTSFRYRDDTGEGDISLFVAAPGASGSDQPDPTKVPCFILNLGGLRRVEDSGTP
jgi:hypothetical protein